MVGKPHLWCTVRYGGGGNFRPGLREDVLARLSVPIRCCQRVVAGSRATVGRMPLPHRLCAPLPQPLGPVSHAGGCAQSGVASRTPPLSLLTTPPQPPFCRTLSLNACSTPCPQYAPTEPESLIYSRQVDVWGAQAGLVVAGYYHANAALDDQR